MIAEVTIACCGQDVLYHPCDGTATCMVCGAHFAVASVKESVPGVIVAQERRT